MIARLLKILHQRPIWSTGVLFVIGMAVILATLFYQSGKMNEASTRQYAKTYVKALGEAHTLYSKDVAKRLKDGGYDANKITHDWRNIPGGIPLPATFSIELSKRLTESGTDIQTRFYSDYPFSFRSDRKIEKFEELILDEFKYMSAEEQKKPIVETKAVNGRKSVIHAQPIFMSDQSCVDCHNGHPASTKTDWKVGDFRGARVVTLPLDTANKTRYAGLAVTFAVMSTLAAIGLGLIFLVVQALRASVNMLSRTNTAYDRFVPHEFLSYLNKKSILDVQLNDNIERQMTILFSDIRSFTEMSENMTPEENFRFVNEYLEVMGPVVRRNNGFIDKYIGDAIMALFDNTDDAVQASLEMFEALEIFNQDHQFSKPIQIGIGVHRGKLRLGTVGERNRMDGTVISDAVNLASRIEGLTKLYGAQCLISEATYHSLCNPENYPVRYIDKVKVRGKKDAVTIFEMFGGDSPELQEMKRATKEKFEDAADLFRVKEFSKAEVLFQAVLNEFPEDQASKSYFERCRKHGKSSG